MFLWQDEKRIARWMRRWEVQREVGALSWIQAHGMPRMTLAIAAPFLYRGVLDDSPVMAWQLMLWLICGAGGGAYLWFLNGWIYRYHLKRKTAEAGR